MRYKVCLLDLDGTVYLGDTLILGADSTIRQLRAQGIRVLFLTNSALESRGSLVTKLEHLGIPATVDDVLTTTFVTVQYLSTLRPGSTIHVIGESELVKELAAAGFRIVDYASEKPENTDFVLISIDRFLTYEKLHFAYLAARSGASVIATNPDRICPLHDGVVLDAGMTIAALENVLQRDIDVLIGKPSPIMVEAVLNHLHVAPDECILVGDRLDTDVAMGKRAGIDTAWIMTDPQSSEALERSDVRPDYIIRRLDELLLL